MATQHEDLGSAITGQVIAAAIAVHREFGPGLDEADYERALHLELLAMGIEHECQVPLQLIYKGTKLDCGYRMDLVVAGWLLLELKAVEKLHPLHEAQLITYLRLAPLKLGLLMNFGSLVLRDGIVRRANSSSPKSRLYAPGEEVQAMDDLSREVMDAAFEVQHLLGTGLLRSAYVAALVHELKQRGLKVEQSLPVNLLYREQLIPSAKELPMIVEGKLMVACVCATGIEPIHLARQKSLLRASCSEVGLCLNFHADSMAAEVRRFSNLTKR
ncbi:MAG: GxxExxY protein [Verrucomicrobiota bacterium]